MGHGAGRPLTWIPSHTEGRGQEQRGFRDVTLERIQRPLSVFVVNWRNIAVTLIDLPTGFSKE